MNSSSEPPLSHIPEIFWAFRGEERSLQLHRLLGRRNGWSFFYLLIIDIQPLLDPVAEVDPVFLSLPCFPDSVRIRICLRSGLRSDLTGRIHSYEPVYDVRFIPIPVLIELDLAELSVFLPGHVLQIPAF